MDDNIKEPLLVSIAVATYNGEKFLKEQLNSLISQTYKNIEIIISDDGSTDGTLEILYDYQKEYPFVSIKQNASPHGIKRNFENALKYCNGKFIAFSDQDDIWMLDKIEKLVNVIGNNALAYHDSLFVDDDGTSLNKTFSDVFRRYSGHNPLAYLLSNSVSGHALLFHRKLLEIALPFPDARHHDWWLAFRAADNGGVKFLDEVLVHYRQHQNSETDFLNLKTKEVDYEKIERENIEWFETCATANGKYQKFIKKWIKVYKERNNNKFNFKMFFMSIAQLNALYAMRKKGTLSNFFYVLKNSWGERTKEKFRNRKKKALTSLN